MKRYDSPKVVLCGYDNDSCRYFASYDGGYFSTQDENVFYSWMRQHLGASHRDSVAGILNRTDFRTETFPAMHSTITLGYVVLPLDPFTEMRPSAYYEVRVYNYASHETTQRATFQSRQGAEEAYRALRTSLSRAEDDLLMFLD